MPAFPKLIEEIETLRAVDHRLRREGIHISSYAEELGMHVRTLKRYLAVLRQLCGPTIAVVEGQIVDRRGGSQSRYVQRYQGSTRRLFAE